ncbi:MAG: hypothetical protein ACO3JN_08420 [Ilumatobacteraceae bacterium]|jgi:hypothetical protein
MSDELSFVEAVIAGKATADQVDDWVDRWHTADNVDTELHTFLGLDEAEMESWLTERLTLEEIIGRRAHD